MNGAPTYDLAVVGAGPGGFDAALRARELGLKVALIEKSDPGGTCLNTGCIPTKALLASSRLLTKISEAKSFGLSVSNVSWDREALVRRKHQIVETLQKGMLETLRRSGVEWLQGEANLSGKNELQVIRQGERRPIQASSILIATGAQPIPFPGVPFDGEKILSSTDLLELKTVPGRLLIIGGGVIGVEFASIFQPLGTKVVIVEMLERLIGNEDEEVSRRLESLFRRKGMEIFTGEKIKSLTPGPEGVSATLESGKKLEADQVLVATGRRPSIASLRLEKAGVRVEKGAIEVNEFLETSAAGIFAVGDVTTRTTGLAHGASAEGVRVVENLKGPKVKMDYGALPNCIYTDPEVASVGLGRQGGGKTSEETLEGKVLFAGLGKPHIEGETEGFVKMIASKKDGRILGVTGIGGRITELMGEAALAVRNRLDLKALAGTVHPHPTESEILQKAAQKLLQALHS